MSSLPFRGAGSARPYKSDAHASLDAWAGSREEGLSALRRVAPVKKPVVAVDRFGRPLVRKAHPVWPETFGLSAACWVMAVWDLGWPLFFIGRLNGWL